MFTVVLLCKVRVKTEPVSMFGLAYHVIADPKRCAGLRIAFYDSYKVLKLRTLC